METVSQNLFVVAGAVILSLLFMGGVDRVWPSDKRRNYNSLIGSQLSILGTTYAVMLGFMLFAVWSAYREADLNVDLEANAFGRHLSSCGRPSRATACATAGLIAVLCGCGLESRLAADGRERGARAKP